MKSRSTDRDIDERINIGRLERFFRVKWDTFCAKVMTKDDDRSLGKKVLKPLSSLRAEKALKIMQMFRHPSISLKNPLSFLLKSAIICHHIPFSHLKASDEDDKETSFSFTQWEGKSMCACEKRNSSTQLLESNPIRRRATYPSFSHPRRKTQK